MSLSCQRCNRELSFGGASKSMRRMASKALLESNARTLGWTEHSRVWICAACQPRTCADHHHQYCGKCPKCHALLPGLSDLTDANLERLNNDRPR